MTHLHKSFVMNMQISTSLNVTNVVAVSLLYPFQALGSFNIASLSQSVFCSF